MSIIEGLDEFQTCPNEHPVHESCLKEWLVKSSTCPLCSEPYPLQIIDKFKTFLEMKEQEKRREIDTQLHTEQMTEVKKATERILLLKNMETIEELIQNGEFEKALDKLDSFGDVALNNNKGQTILFLKGKINFTRGRYDLAINQLFRLVKEKFDFPDAFLYLGKSYEAIGLNDKAKWAFDRVK